MSIEANPPSALLAGLPERQGFGDATLITRVAGSIDLGGGNPDPELLPVDVYRDAADALFSSSAFTRVLRYSPAQGNAELREAIAEREGVDPGRVIVTDGGAQGLALAVLGLLDAGDTVIVDDPVYPLFLRTLDLTGRRGMRVVSVPVTRDGLDVGALRELLSAGLRPRALFTVPTFHNPSGVTLSSRNGDALVALAEQYDFTVIADDPYREIVFPGTEVPSRRGMLASERVVSVGTFSKTLGPGLRLGWLVVPKPLVHGYVKLRNRLDGQSSQLLQALVTRMLADPRYDAALARAGAGYARKAAALSEALRSEFGADVELADPTGGFFTWARLGGDLDFGAVFDRAQANGVTYQRGEWFQVPSADETPADAGQRFRGYVRLTYSEPPISDLQEGVARLATAWRDVAAARTNG